MDKTTSAAFTGLVLCFCSVALLTLIIQRTKLGRWLVEETRFSGGLLIGLLTSTLYLVFLLVPALEKDEVVALDKQAEVHRHEVSSLTVDLEGQKRLVEARNATLAERDKTIQELEGKIVELNNQVDVDHDGKPDVQEDPRCLKTVFQEGGAREVNSKGCSADQAGDSCKVLRQEDPTKSRCAEQRWEAYDCPLADDPTLDSDGDPAHTTYTGYSCTAGCDDSHPGTYTWGHCVSFDYTQATDAQGQMHYYAGG